MEMTKAVETVKTAMPVLVDSFGEDEVRTSVKRVVERNVQADGPTKKLVLSALSGDLDDAGLRLLVEVAEDLSDRLL